MYKTDTPFTPLILIFLRVSIVLIFTGPFARANHLMNKKPLKYPWLTPTEPSDTAQINWFFLQSSETLIRVVLCNFERQEQCVIPPT